MAVAAVARFHQCRCLERRGSGGSVHRYGGDAPLGDRAFRRRRARRARIVFEDASGTTARDYLAGSVGMSIRKNTWAIVLAGGNGVRLRSLTIDSNGRAV